MRRDSFGFFWDDSPKPDARGKVVRTNGPRPLPAIPDTGWVQKDFPRLDSAKIIALDTETKDPDLVELGPGVRRGAHIVGISVATEDHRSWYFPMRHEVGGGMNLPPENVIRWAQDNLTRPNQLKIGANLIYDLDFLAEEGVEVAGPFSDVQVTEALLNENRFSFALQTLSLDYLGRGKDSSMLEAWIRAAYGIKHDFRENIYRTPPSLVGPYAEVDAINPLEIHLRQMKEIKAQGLQQVYDIEAGLMAPLLAMRRRGVRIDMNQAKRVEDELEQNVKRDQARLDHLAGFPVNVDGKKDLVRMFDAENIEYPRTAATRKHPTGQPSFTKEFLEYHPAEIARLVKSIRHWNKFQDTFVRGYIYKMQVKGRVHCQFNQTKGDDYGAVSGRFSSSLPNLQNIPARDPYWGPLIRAMFLPEEGHEWGKLDWSQIEFRIVTDYGKGESAERARQLYIDDATTDFHLMVANMTGVNRKHAKNINFGLVYGMGEYLLALQLGISLDEARPILAQYHEQMPFIKDAYGAASEEAQQIGFITTLLGRRRRFDLWQPRRPSQNERHVGLPQKAALSRWGLFIKRAFTHKSLNAYVQGSAADLMKKALKDYWDSSMMIELEAPLLTVHDELDFSIPPTPEAREAFAEVKRLMETCLKLSVPIIADSDVGPNWGFAND